VTLPGAVDHYRRGLALYGKRDYSQAIEAYRLALAERPEWGECLQALGMAQMHAGRLQEALSNLERVTKLLPEDPLAFTSLSMCLQRLERIADAESAQAQARLLSWKQELKSNPKAPPPSGGMAPKRGG
jgi:tetratricopeptide (TPR) repeat protein